MTEQAMYRLCEVKQGVPHTLFHGVLGKRSLTVGVWIHADRKLVHDGTNGTKYISGFHCLPTIDDCREYQRQFTADRELGIYRIIARECRPKSHSRSLVYLAEWMKLQERV